MTRTSLSLLTALLTLTAAHVASACLPPPPPWLLGKHLPVDGATHVPINSALLLLPTPDLEERAVEERAGAWCELALRGAEAEGPVLEGPADYWRDGYRFTPSEPLAPDTEYTARCVVENYDYANPQEATWTFQTAAAPAALPLNSRFIAAHAFNAMRDEIRCEWTEGSCSFAPQCDRKVDSREHGEVEAQLEVVTGDWAEVMVFMGSAATAEAAMWRAREAAQPTVVPAGELDLAADAGRAHDNDSGELCTAVIIESMAGEEQAIDAHCVEAPEPETAPPAPTPEPEFEVPTDQTPVEQGPAAEAPADQAPEGEEAGGCSVSAAPGGAGWGWVLLLCLGLSRRRR